jgi:hypothetical protein
MLPKFCKRCGFWLTILSLAQLLLLCMALNALYVQLKAEDGAVFKNIVSLKVGELFLGRLEVGVFG